jgi:ferredoxin
MPRVSLKDTNIELEVNEGEILYDALYDRGTELPHGCLSGSCGACRVEVLEGANNLVPAGLIEQNTIEAVCDEFVQTRGEDFIKNKTVRLSCRAKVLGDITIKPIK